MLHLKSTVVIYRDKIPKTVSLFKYLWTTLYRMCNNNIVYDHRSLTSLNFSSQTNGVSFCKRVKCGMVLWPFRKPFRNAKPCLIGDKQKISMVWNNNLGSQKLPEPRGRMRNGKTLLIPDFQFLKHVQLPSQCFGLFGAQRQASKQLTWFRE